MVGDDYDYGDDFDNFQCQLVAVAVAAISRLNRLYIRPFTICPPVFSHTCLIIVHFRLALSASLPLRHLNVGQQRGVDLSVFNFFADLFVYEMKERRTVNDV